MYIRNIAASKISSVYNIISSAIIAQYIHVYEYWNWAMLIPGKAGTELVYDYLWVKSVYNQSKSLVFDK